MKYHHKLHHWRLTVLRRIQGIQPSQVQPFIQQYYRSSTLYKLQKTELFTKLISTANYKQFYRVRMSPCSICWENIIPSQLFRDVFLRRKFLFVFVSAQSFSSCGNTPRYGVLWKNYPGSKTVLTTLKSSLESALRL